MENKIKSPTLPTVAASVASFEAARASLESAKKSHRAARRTVAASLLTLLAMLAIILVSCVAPKEARAAEEPMWVKAENCVIAKQVKEFKASRYAASHEKYQERARKLTIADKDRIIGQWEECSVEIGLGYTVPAGDGLSRKFVSLP